MRAQECLQKKRKERSKSSRLAIFYTQLERPCISEPAEGRRWSVRDRVLAGRRLLGRCQDDPLLPH